MKLVAHTIGMKYRRFSTTTTAASQKQTSFSVQARVVIESARRMFLLPLAMQARVVMESASRTFLLPLAVQAMVVMESARMPFLLSLAVFIWNHVIPMEIAYL